MNEQEFVHALVADYIFETTYEAVVAIRTTEWVKANKKSFFSMVWIRWQMTPNESHLTIYTKKSCFIRDIGLSIPSDSEVKITKYENCEPGQKYKFRIIK